jgi:multiple sugar transport system permease protein
MQRTSTLLRNGLFSVVTIVVFFWVLFPFYWAFLNSIKNPEDTFEPSWIPFLQFRPTLAHWRSELSTPETLHALLNSTMISIGAATLALFLGTLAAYALARFRFNLPSNGTITTWFISQRVFPPVVFVIPFFLLMRQFQLLDSVLALVLVNATYTHPIAVIIMSQMFREVPKELEEAAWVDGASHLQSFSSVVLPLVAPGLAATWIICMAFSWNEFLFALSLTNKSAVPMPVIIAGAQDTRGVQFWFVGVRVLLTMLPPTILALLAQRYIVRGLTLGALKG